MSLVNDALKRATEVQKNRAPVPVVHLPLRPVEPAKLRKTGIGLALPATLLTIIVAAFFSLHFAKRAEQKGVSTLAPSSLPVEKPANKSAGIIHDLAPAPLIVAAKEVPAIPPPAIAPPAPAVFVAPPSSPLRLQAVFYTPPHPSAIISGKTVCVGDTVRELQVVAIGSSSVLLISQSQTNFLTMEQ